MYVYIYICMYICMDIHNIACKMKIPMIIIRKTVKLCYAIFLFFLSAALLLFIYRRTTAATTLVNPPDPPSLPGLKIRPGYTTYDSYIQHQLNKTLNPKLRLIWKTRDWSRKVRVFTSFFQHLQALNLLSTSSKALCIGARTGQEVEALRRIGVADSIGIDLVASPPLVVNGDFHNQPFDDATFDFEFSNVFDHALYPVQFVDEIERTLKPGGVCVLHVAVSTRSDKYSANDLLSIDPLKNLFKRSQFVYTRPVDGFGLDTEVVFKKMQG